MDGFALPPFEFTYVLKDKDVISVKKKGENLTELGDDVNSLEGEGMFLENRPVVTGEKVLANEEFNKENGGYDGSDSEDNQSKQLEGEVLVESTPKRSKVSKKRKGSEKLSSLKKKKSKVGKAETSPASHAAPQDDVHRDGKRSSRRRNVSSKKKDVEEDMSQDEQKETEKSSSPDVSRKTDDISEPLSDSERPCQLEEEDHGNTDASQTLNGSKKLPSRSARRKKAKRRWLREQAGIEKELQQKQLLEKDNQHLPSKDSFKASGGQEQPVQNGEDYAENDNDINAETTEDNTVPIVVRPGHIRFEPLDKDENQAVQKTQFSVETYQWNGIKSKKKGQKWGKESSKRKTYNNLSQTCSEELNVEEEIPVTNQVEFDKLMLYPSLPKEGDIVAYRLIELSSSWIPELSPFRVGKISNYDSTSNRIVLETVPEYPMTNQEKIDEEASGPQPDTSIFREDGTLETDYSSLVDLRLVKNGPNSAKSVAIGANEARMHDKDATTSTRPNGSIEESSAPPKENGAANAWEEIAQTLNAKKAELSAEDEWNNAKSSGKNPWSYGALRRNALGPTIAILRAQNDI